MNDEVWKEKFEKLLNEDRKVNKVLSLIIIIFSYTLGFGGDSKEIYPFDDGLQEEIFQSLLNEIRCPKCQSSNLAGSNSL